MTDANGEESEDVHIDIKDNKLVITANKEWLLSINRKYPIIIDPSLQLAVLTIQSHPQKGDNWEVEFKTEGQADLRIIPNDQASIDDDEFKGLYCGNKEMTPQILADDVIFYSNWRCKDTAKVIHYTKKAGDHTLRFEFGGQVSFAYNSESTYNFIGVTQDSNDYYAHEEYPEDGFSGPTDTGESEATNTDYDNIESDNGVRWETAGATNDGEYDSQLYQFFVDEDKSSISQLDFKWSGYGEIEAGYNTTFYAYDYDGTQWVQLDQADFATTTDQDLTHAESSDPGKFIDTDGEVTLMVKTKKYAADLCETCSCSGSSYETISCSGDTVYVDCNADKCWSPTAGSTYVWGPYTNNSSCVGDGSGYPACNYCDALDWGGKTDWTLPNYTTLLSLCNTASCSGTCFGGDGSNYYWSSTEIDLAKAWAVLFTGCGSGVEEKPSKNHYVRCVR